MTLPRWSPERVRPDEAPELVTSRNLESLSPVLSAYASQVEKLSTTLATAVAKLSRMAYPYLQGLAVMVGANSRMGTAVLVGGTVTVSNTSVTASTYVFLSRSIVGGTLGHLSYTVSAGVGFTVTSSSGTDTSTVKWLLVEPF